MEALKSQGIFKIVFLLLIVILLAGCDLPKMFLEEEGRKVIDDVVVEETKITPAPAEKTITTKSL
jgi:hypothetical protein